MQTPYDWVLFDADNTLFDFHRCERFALQSAMAESGHKFEEFHHAAYSRFNMQCWRDFEDRKITKGELRSRRFQLFIEAFELSSDPTSFGDNYLAHLSSAAFLLDGAIDLLQELKQNYRLALVTNGLKEVQRPRLKAAKLIPYFEAIIVSDEIGYSKPHRPFFDYTFAQIGQPEKDRVLIIGDNVNADVKGGLDYGIHACWYNPHTKEKPLDVQPTFEIRHLWELILICVTKEI